MSIRNRIVRHVRVRAGDLVPHEQNARVHPDAHKTQIRQAIEALFDVSVLEVRTMSVKSKPKRRGAIQGRTRSWKKAMVQIGPGESIPIFQSLQGLEG